MELSTKQKTILIGIAIALIAVSIITVAVAAVTWTGTRNHTQPASAFTVDKAATLDYGTVSSAEEMFTITNTGNIPVTITPSASGAGGAYGWDKPSATIAPGATTTFTLTSTFTASGTVTITFTPS